MPPLVGTPFARAEIVTELAALHRASTEFWSAFEDGEFFAPLGDAWSPADNVRHLDRSLRPLVQGLRLPVPVIWLLFGPARRPSRGYVEIRTLYRAELERGLTAPARYVPPPIALDDPAATRRELMARRELRHRSLDAAISRWEESDLDRCRLPHPAPGIGRLTVREMLLFTLYHNLHHVEGVARRVNG